MAKVGYDSKQLSSVVARLTEAIERVKKLASDMAAAKLPSVRFDNEGFKNRAFDDLDKWLDRAEADCDAAVKAKVRGDKAARATTGSQK